MARSAPMLADSFVESSRLRPLVKPGIKGLARKDAKLVAPFARRQVGDSLDFDAATVVESPQENRWDYLLSVPSLDSIVGLEPHSARDSEISVVIRKRRNALQILRSHLREGRSVSKWLWITRGKVGFSHTETARRRLDQSGIEFVGKTVRTFG